jgi:C1A family cysteine protease
VIKKFKQKPPESAMKFANIWGNLSYEKVRVSTPWIKAALSEGFPIVIGTMLYDSFDEVGQNGVVKLPDLDKESEIGGHCMLLLGYELGHFIVANSWNKSWGDQGYCYFPERYLASATFGSSDYWIIKNLGGA